MKEAAVKATFEKFATTTRVQCMSVKVDKAEKSKVKVTYKTLCVWLQEQIDDGQSSADEIFSNAKLAKKVYKTADDFEIGLLTCQAEMMNYIQSTIEANHLLKRLSPGSLAWFRPVLGGPGL